MSSSRSDGVTQSVLSFFRNLFFLVSKESLVYLEVSLESQEVSRVFQGCFKGVLRMFQGSFTEVSKVFQRSFKRISSNIKGCFKGVSRKFKGSFKKVLRALR